MAHPSTTTYQAPRPAAPCTEEEEEDMGSLEDLIDDEVADPQGHQYEDNTTRADKLSRTLLFLVQELGSFKKNQQGEEIYVPGPTCDKAVQDLVRHCRADKPDDPLVKYYLGKWATLKKDLLPLFLSQAKNRRLLYYLLTTMAYLTSPVERACDNTDEHQAFLEEYKELLSMPEFSEVLVAVLGSVVSATDKTKFHDNMIELIMTLVRNVLQIETSARNVADTYKESLQLKLYSSFSKEGGVFDALTFMCQDMKSPLNRRLRLVFLEIYYHVLSTFPASFLFGQPSEEQYFKNLREKEKILRLQRLNQLSTRHSRFGAMFQVSRKIGGTAAITGNIKFNKDDLNKTDAQRNKPKPNKRYASKDGPLPGNRFIDEHHGVLSEEEKVIQIKLKHFVADFLEHAYGPLVDSLYDLLSKEAPELVDLDYLHFFNVVSFGVECYNLEIARYLPKGDSQPFSRTQTEEKMVCKLQAMISGIQVTLVDLLYKALLSQVSRKKAEFNIPLYQSLLQYFSQLLRVTLLLGQSVQPNDQKNSKLLKQVVFSKEFGKILKVGLNYYEPRLHSKTFAETLVKTTEEFFNLLAKEAKDKVMFAQTDKMVRRALRRPAERDPPETQDGQDRPHPIEEDPEDEREMYMAQERKYNYFSEFCSFVDYPTVQKFLLLVRGERLLWNTPQLNSAVYHYVQRIVEDVNGEWVFFQHDFLHYFNEILSNSMITLKSELQPFCALIRKIVKAFFQTLKKNNCLCVEANCRYPDVAIKDQILNDYTTPDITNLGGQSGQVVSVIERPVLPWSRAEDLILVHNYDTFKSDDKLLERLAELLRDQAYFRELKEIKLRVRLLRLDQSKDVALQLVDETHKPKPLALPQVVSRILLSTRVTMQSHLESALQKYLETTVQQYEEYAQLFALTPNTYPLVPVTTDDCAIQELEAWPSLMQYLQAHPPTAGAIYSRLPSGLPLREMVGLLQGEMARLNNSPEEQLLDLAEYDNPKALRDRTNLSNTKRDKPEKKGAVRMSKKHQRLVREEMMKANRELAGLASSDEEIPLNVESSEDEYPVPAETPEESAHGDDGFGLDSPAKSPIKGAPAAGDESKKFKRLKKPGGAVKPQGSSRGSSPGVSETN